MFDYWQKPPIMIICVGNSAPSLCFSPIRKEFLTQFRCVYWCPLAMLPPNMYEFFLLTYLAQIPVTILCWFKSQFEFLLQSMFELLAQDVVSIFSLSKNAIWTIGSKPLCDQNPSSISSFLKTCLNLCLNQNPIFKLVENFDILWA